MINTRGNEQSDGVWGFSKAWGIAVHPQYISCVTRTMRAHMDSRGSLICTAVHEELWDVAAGFTDVWTQAT